MADVKHDTKRSETQLIGECRIAYPFHFEKRTKTAGGALLKSPRNDAVVLVPKLGPAETCPNYAKLSAMAMEAATKAWGSWPDGGKWPIQDGDIPHAHKPKPGEKALTPEQITERNKWRVGSWVVEVATNLAQGPKVSLLQGGAMQDIPAQDINGVRMFKSGDYGYVSMNAYSFQRETWGVNFSYEGVAYTRPGELIGGGPKSTAQMFAGIPIGTTGPGMVRQPAPPIPGAASVASPPLAPVAPVAPVYAPAPGAPPMPPSAPVAHAVGVIHGALTAAVGAGGPPPLPPIPR